VLGFFVSGHPLSRVAHRIARFANVTSTRTEEFDGREVRAGGLLTSLREKRTRRGSLMGFCNLEDTEGAFELVIFGDTFAEYGSLVRRAIEGENEDGPIPVLVSGTLEAGDPPKILVRQILELEGAEGKLANQLRSTVLTDEATPDRLRALRDLLQKNPGDCSVVVRLIIAGESETWLGLDGVSRVRPHAALLVQSVDGS